ncbi:MAG: HAMP domain-containing protein, partial [Verrucomicrobiae bacterium]|nr:HAMP domain-containing protein [Verrucomicrobiae bacterium]
MSDPNASAGAPPALPTWKSAPADAAMLLGLLAGLNWVVSRDDPGWLGLNPTPWILLPLFLGGRYGLAAALIGSVLAAGAILGLTWAVEGWAAALAAPSGRPFFFLSLLIAGAIGSTIHHLVSGPLRRVHRHATELAAKNRELAEESALYRENESLLQESLLLWGADYASLTEEAHRLFSADARRLDDALLGVLRRVFGVTGAAVYRTGRAGDEEESLPRVAHSGGGEGLPDRISREESGTVWGEALRSRRLVTCREIWESAEAGAGSPENGAVLAAIPWRAGAGDAAAAASVELSDSLWRARVVQTIAAALAVAVALLVGWWYVGRRVIGRLGALRSAMEHQAQGQAVAIPVDGRDEIGAMARALTSFVDQRREAEVALRLAKFEAEQANKAKSTFLAAMSHELRTPLNAVLGFSEMIRDRYYGSIGDARYSEYAGDIYASGRYLLDLINDILDLSKIEAGKMEMELCDCSPFQVVAEVVNVMQMKAQQQNLVLESSVHADVPMRVVADPMRLRQIVTNLVGNAIK